MKSLLLLIQITFITALLANFTFANDKNSNSNESILIQTYSEDITGDGLKETINLWGVLLSSDSDYYREIWTDITTHDSKHWSIIYGGGYRPELLFIDLTHDNVSDLFYQSSTGDSEGFYNQRVDTLINQDITEIPLPRQPFIGGEFKDDLKVEISLSPNETPIIVSVKDRIKEYLKTGIYDKEGRLQKDKEILIQPTVFYEPTFISESKGYGLRSYQQISGAFHTDKLGVNETLWYLDENDWIILRSKWVPEV